MQEQWAKIRLDVCFELAADLDNIDYGAIMTCTEEIMIKKAIEIFHKTGRGQEQNLYTELPERFLTVDICKELALEFFGNDR